MFWNEVRRLRALRVDVPEDLRGWRWDSSPVAPPPLGVRISASDIANRYCPTGRDLYLKRRVRAEPSPAMLRGRYLHAVFKHSLNAAASIIEGGAQEGWELLQRFSPEEVAGRAACEVGTTADEHGAKLARSIAVRVAAELEGAASRLGIADPRSLAARAVPLVAEYAVDGGYIGLTQLKIDALLLDIVLEVKTGRPIDEHRLALAAYAMALEAEYEIPVDHGLLVYISVNSRVSIRAVPVAIGASLRRWFLEARDELMELVASGRDPGTAGNCERTCPFYPHCHGAGN